MAETGTQPATAGQPTSFASAGKSLRQIWNDKFLATPFTGLAGLLIAALTPARDVAKEYLFPTQVTAEGRVWRGPDPYGGALVVLDDAHCTNADSLGDFGFDDVRKGSHMASLVENGRRLVTRRFTVTRGMEQTTLDPISFDPNQPTHVEGSEGSDGLPPCAISTSSSLTASATAAASTPEATPGASVDAGAVDLVSLVSPIYDPSRQEGGPEAFSVTWRIDGAPEDLEQIQEVMYRLDETFSPSEVKRFNPADGFALTFTSPLPTRVVAFVSFRDGRSIELEGVAEWQPGTSEAGNANSGANELLAKIFGGAQLEISQPFGITEFAQDNPVFYEYCKELGQLSGTHCGVDVSVPFGTPVYSPVAGTVVCAGTGVGGDDTTSCTGFACVNGGNADCGPTSGRLELVLDGGDRVIFGGMSAIDVEPGERVDPGERIGRTSGQMGPAVHLEIRILDPTTDSGYRAVDPLSYLSALA